MVLEKMKKQREIQHALQKRLTAAEESEKSFHDSMRTMDEDYSNQINQFKAVLQEKIDLISKLSDELDKESDLTRRYSYSNCKILLVGVIVIQVAIAGPPVRTLLHYRES